jgi:hypothetical protein
VRSRTWLREPCRPAAGQHRAAVQVDRVDHYVCDVGPLDLQPGLICPASAPQGWVESRASAGRAAVKPLPAIGVERCGSQPGCCVSTTLNAGGLDGVVRPVADRWTRSQPLAGRDIRIADHISSWAYSGPYPAALRGSFHPSRPLGVFMSITTTPESVGRNVGLDQLAKLLHDQSTRKLDVIAATGAIRAIGGNLVLDGTEPLLGPDGVTMSTGSYNPNEVCNAGIADKLAIPSAYLRRLAADHVDLYDENVNGWLARTDRRFLIRVLRNDAGGGIARAFLSDRYSRIDNLDVLMAALDGVRQSGVDIQVDGCDLTERRMYLRIYSPQVSAIAPVLLGDYRSPFTGQRGADLPVVWGGFLISNSETGCGAFTISPRLMVQVCKNGLVLNANKVRRTHLGSRHDDDGVIEWSDDTNTKTLELITSRTKDAVAAYLNTDYVTRMIRDLEKTAGAPVDDPDTTIKTVAQRMRFTDDQQRDLLAHFIKGADLTAGGVMHAVTSLAQTLTDADAAHDMEAAGVTAMHLAAAVN